MERYTIRGYFRLVRLTAAKTWQCVYLLTYAVSVGFLSFGSWSWKQLVSFTAKYPKASIGIVGLLFFLHIIGMRVAYRMDFERQNMRYDSLLVVKDSIERYSSFDSGYSKGLHDANILRYGLKEKEDSIY